MATLGTNANNSLTAYVYSEAPAVLVPANMATIKAGIKDDANQTVSGGPPAAPGGTFSPNSYFDYNGLLMIPRRGLLRVFPGDVVAFDTVSGWPILVSAQAIAITKLPGSVWTYA